MPNQAALHGLCQQAMTLLKSEMDVRDSKGQAKYADTCEWFSSILATPEQRMKHTTMLQELLNQCLPQGQQVPRTTAVPDSFSRTHGPDEVLLHLPLRLWQLGVHESSHVKGAPPLHGVRDNLQRFLYGLGCETSKYHIEILFHWPHQWSQFLNMSQSSSPTVRMVEDFSVAVSMGSSVTMACHLLSCCTFAVARGGSPRVCQVRSGCEACEVLVLLVPNLTFKPSSFNVDLLAPKLISAL